MALQISQSNSSKLPTRLLTSKRPKQSMFRGHHATVNCSACHRTMVPRVVSYYGLPLRSICPFCGTTFMKFHSGFQRFMRGFHRRTVSFAALKQFITLTLGFVLLWFASDWGNLSDKISLLALFGTFTFAALSLSELLFQCVERLAERLSHESNYYWAALVLIAVIIANVRHDLTSYILLFFVVLLIRSLISGVVQDRTTIT